MANTYRGASNDLSSTQKPSGYTSPSITQVASPDYDFNVSLSILKATVDEATTAATMDAIFDNGTIGIDKQIEDIINTDFDDGVKTIVSSASLITLTTNIAAVGGEDTWLKSTAVSYVATVRVKLTVV